MDDEYEWDIFEVFKEQVELQLPKIEENILNLGDANLADNSIDELFRTFHSYKPNAQYLLLNPFYDVTLKAEMVLSTLRETKRENKKIDEAIIEWFLQALDYITLFSQEMEMNKTLLSPVPVEFLNALKLTSSYTKPSEKLKKLQILYVDENKKRITQVSTYLKKISNCVTSIVNIDDVKKYIMNHQVDILIINCNKKNHALIQSAKKVQETLAIIAIFDKLTTLSSKELLKKGISHTTTNPLNAKNLNRELMSLVKIYFSSSNIIINHKTINTFIQTLEPLPNTIFQIMQICDDEEIPVKELTKVVKTDPIISAHILNIANSPLYGSVTLKTIDQAVTKFGKRAVKALCMGGLYNSLGTINLKAYDITEETFSHVSMMRLSLMLKWYAKVSICDLSILSSTALLGNIGQLLIAQEIASLGEMKNFKKLSQNMGISYAEEAIVATTTNIISSQILNYWKLSKDIVDVISYSDNPNEAPQEMRKLVIANYIVYNIVDLKGEVAPEIPDFLLPTLVEYGFDVKHLQNALEYLHSTLN